MSDPAKQIRETVAASLNSFAQLQKKAVSISKNNYEATTRLYTIGYVLSKVGQEVQDRYKEEQNIPEDVAIALKEYVDSMMGKAIELRAESVDEMKKTFEDL